MLLSVEAYVVSKPPKTAYLIEWDVYLLVAGSAGVDFVFKMVHHSLSTINSLGRTSWPTS